jgi:hypothetical protein
MEEDKREQGLRESEEGYKLLFERNLAGVFRGTLLSRRILDCNDAYARILGYDSRQEVLNCGKLHDFYEPVELEIARTRLLKEKALTNFEARFRRKDQTPVWVLVNVSLIQGREGKEPLVEGTLIDITERKQAEQALAQERELLRTLMDNLPDCIYFKDRQSRFLRVSRALAKVLGLGAPGQAVGKADFDFYTMEQAQQFYNDEQEVITTGKPVIAKEERQTWPDGRVTWFSTTKMPFRDADGAIIGTFGVSRDITQSKQAEADLLRYAQDLESAKATQEGHAEELARLVEELARERELLRTLMDNLPDYIYFKDRQSRFLRTNVAHARAFGLSDPGQAVGKTDFDFFTTEHAQQAYNDEQEVILTGKPMMAKEEKETWPDGRVTWVSTTKMPFRDADGAIIGTFGLSRDITEHKRAEQALRESEERYRDLADNAADLIQSLSPEGRYLYVNRAWREALGYSEEEVSHLHMRDIIIPEHLPYCQEVLARVLRGESVGDVAAVFVTKTGKRVAVQGSVNCRLVDGKPVAMPGIFRDVTARLEVEKMKNEFVSTVSHELRTPLTSIRGALGLLTSGKLSADSAKAQRMLEIAVANTDRLIRLINEILEIERIQSGRVKLEKRSCLVASLLAQAVDAVREVANKAGVNLELYPACGNVLADSDRVVQTLTNLLGNAIKFSPSGKAVSLSATRRDDEMLFEVKDRGRGIPRDKLGVIFERFQQVDASDRREKGGSGLGLAICRSIVDQHGGRIWVESQLGQGSSFYFTLPLVKEPGETPAPEASPAQRTVLVCDDDPSVRMVLKTLLEQHGFRVLAAASGREAIQQALAWQPDALLLDLLMPEMDGWETLAALRERPSTREIPMIILSVLPPRQTRKADGEVAGWVQKPVDEALLFQTLSGALSKSSKSARVLIVEDDLDLARVIQEVFQRHGNKVFHAQTGCEAIQSAERVFPDLIVLDLVLPEGDGFDVVASLRHNKALRSVPLVVYTAKDIDEAERERLKLGETVFLTKGRIPPEEFERRVIGLLDRLMSG